MPSLSGLKREGTSVHKMPSEFITLT
jgi:hypothetical protein